MYTQQITIDYSHSTANKEFTLEYIDLFLDSLRKSGQILGKCWLMYEHDNYCSAIVMTPEKTSLEPSNAHYYVERSIVKLTQHQISFTHQILGRDPEGAEYCQCDKPTAYIMYTLNTSVESPIRCADCFYPVPLYKLPTFEDHDYLPLLCWQADFDCCDELQMRCYTLERAGIREMSKLDSSLTEQGLTCRATLANNTKRPVYYYLYRYNSRSIKQELARKCPSCNGDWLLEKEWHDTFAFRCDRCYLVSNFAYTLLRPS